MSIRTERTPVVAIIGAGLSGLSLALFLRAAIPAHITIFESRSRQAYDEGYLTLAPNSLHQLDQLGLYEVFLQYGHAFEELKIRSARRNGSFSIGSVTNGSRKRYGYPALRISRHILRHILLAEVDEDPMIEVNFNKDLIEIFESMDYNGAEESVFVRFADGSIDGFDYVIGADGVHSRVRKVLSKDEAAFTGFVSIGGGETKRSSLSTDQTLPCMFRGRSNDIMIAPTSADGSYVSAFTIFEMNPRPNESWKDPAPSKVEIIRLIQQNYCAEVGQWPDVVQKVCRDMCDPEKQCSLTIWPLFQSPELHSRTTSSGRIILVGDAAHAMIGGQSAAMALEDAASLAKVFADVFDNTCGDSIFKLPAALGRWQFQRQKRCKEVEAFTMRGEILRRSSKSQFEQILKEWLLWFCLLVQSKDEDSHRVYGHREPGPSNSLDEKEVKEHLADR